MRVYKLEFRCEKCNKDFSTNFRSKYKLTQNDLERFTDKIKQKHNFKEHTYCIKCGEKIPDGKGYIRIVGRKDPTEEDRKRGVDFILLTGIFCERCKKIFDEEEKKIAKI